MKLAAVASVLIFVAALQLKAHKVTSDYQLTPISLPGASGVVALDYFAYDRSTDRVWVPASNTGNVDVIDGSSDAVSQVTGFKTGEVELRGRKITLGPTAVSVGDGVVYIGNRGDSSLCVIDAQTLKRGECLQVGGSGGRAGRRCLCCGDKGVMDHNRRNTHRSGISRQDDPGV